jgi:AGCS family alanine or glycine:cation symporter
MALRFAEVYLSVYCAAGSTSKAGLGGPMLYLRRVPGGHYLSYCYGAGVLIFSLIGGNAVQVNTMGLSLYTTWGISIKLSAVMFFLFIVYIVTGGARRIAQASEAIVPLKVGLFLISSIIVLCFHYQAIGGALHLIMTSAFHSQAFAGGALGFTVQQAMRFGVARVLFATESGLGTAAILFGSTGSKTPVQDAIMSMLSTFISTVVCFIVALCIIASGVWDNGLTSAALTISAFNTAFGGYGGWVVSFLSLTFGVGVLVSYAYITRAAWLFLTGGKYAWAINLIYCCVAFVGTLSKVDAVWYACDIVQSVLLIINLFAIVYLIPLIRKGLAAYRTNNIG